MATAKRQNDWGCMDLGAPLKVGTRRNYIKGSKQEFDDCPGGYLRTSVPEPGTLGRMVDESVAEHLDSGQHPWFVIGPLVEEHKNGSVRMADLTPKVADLLQLALSEDAERQSYEWEQRQAERERERR